MKLDHRHFLAGCAVVASTALACGADRPTGNVRAEQIVAPPSTDGGISADGGVVVGCKTLAVCSDAQALAIANAANQGEIDEASAVVDRLQDEELRAFAQQMIADHTKLRDAAALAASTPTNGSSVVTPQPNAISQKLQRDTRRSIAELEALEDANLDRAYLEHQVFAHLTTMALMDQIVVPSISNPALAMAIASGAPLIRMHETHALQIQSRLQGLCGGAIAVPDAGAPDAANGEDAGNGADAATEEDGGGLDL